MKMENAIEVNEVYKKFRIYKDKGSTLKEKLLFSNRRVYDERSVLNGISISVKQGEAIGLIGHNGCGKSTTLKLLSKIMYPDSGKIEMRGRISSLIELGAGFHPDMSGKENIYINASIFGLTKKEIDSRLEDIIDFSELEAYMDNPVRTYSSGMYMRLAFAVAINVNADILLIDEILAVGDAAFQAKCFDRLRKIKAQGVTIVIVSHAMGQIEQICDRSIWIDNGQIKVEGEPRDVHPQYMEFMGRRSAEHEERTQNRKEKEKIRDNTEKDHYNKGKKIEEMQNPIDVNIPDAKEIDKEKINRFGSKNIVVDEITMVNSKNSVTKTFITGESFKIKIKYKVKKPMENVVVGVGFWNFEGKNCYGTNTMIDQLTHLRFAKDGEIEFVSDNMSLLSGIYQLQIAFTDTAMLPIDYWNNAFEFEVRNSFGDIGISRIEHKWKV